MKTCRREFSRAARAGQSISVLSIDIDHFKKYNYGHDAGNTVFVLSAIAWKICSATKTFRAGSAARNSSSLCAGRTPGPGRLDRDPGVHCDYPRHETARAA
jgi:hypothetical protein